MPIGMPSLPYQKVSPDAWLPAHEVGVVECYVPKKSIVKGALTGPWKFFYLKRRDDVEENKAYCCLKKADGPHAGEDCGYSVAFYQSAKTMADATVKKASSAGMLSTHIKSKHPDMVPVMLHASGPVNPETGMDKFVRKPLSDHELDRLFALSVLHDGQPPQMCEHFYKGDALIVQYF